MTQGPVDNYLSEEEQAYFDKRGSESAELKVEESLEDGANNVPDEIASDNGYSDGDTLQPEASDESEKDSDTADEDSEDEEVGAESKRDYEKAFKAERHKRKELKEAMEANVRKTLEMEATLAALKATVTQGQQNSVPQRVEPQEVIPDPEVDPLGYQQYKIDKLEKTISQHNQYLSAQEQARQAEMKKSAFIQQYKQSADEFKKSTTDFDDAYKFLSDSRMREYVEAGFSPAEAHGMAIEDELNVVAKAYQDKVNPADRIYKLAKVRGYTQNKVAPEKAKKDLSNIQNGIKNSKSLKSGGGELPDREFGIEDVDSMNFDEFDTYWNKFKQKAKKL